MSKQFIHKIAAMELEEKILNLGAFIGLIGVFMPWISGEWLGGDSVTHTGFGYYTGYMGLATAGLHLFVLLVAFLPLSGGPPLVQKEKKEGVRFFASLQAAILTLASLSVIAKTTMDFARLEIRFGIYLSLIGSLVAALYTYLRYQEQKKREVQELFHHPQAAPQAPAEPEQPANPPSEPRPNMAPPKQSAPEEHKLHTPHLHK